LISGKIFSAGALTVAARRTLKVSGLAAARDQHDRDGDRKHNGDDGNDLEHGQLRICRLR
jgi:hypothetical protein